MAEDDRATVRNAVASLLDQGFITDGISPTVDIGEPLTISNPDGTRHSWLVPLLNGTKLEGFVQLLPSLVPTGCSVFRRNPDDPLPEAGEWTDVNRVLARAATAAREGEILSSPILTYDGVPSRIAWKVVATPTRGGAVRSIFVFGATVYEGSGRSGIG